MSDEVRWTRVQNQSGSFIVMPMKDFTQLMEKAGYAFSSERPVFGTVDEAIAEVGLGSRPI